MNKETKIELLKIIGMVVILCVIILGIIWVNSDNTSNNISNSTTTESESLSNEVDDDIEEAEDTNEDNIINDN